MAKTTLLPDGTEVWIGNRVESYGGMRGATADHLVIADRALCGLRGSLVREPLTRRALPWTGCRKCGAVFLDEGGAMRRSVLERHLGRTITRN